MGTLDTFGKRLRFARLKRELSQSGLAKALAQRTRNKTSKSLVSQWELGRVSNPQNSTVLALIDELLVSQRWLIDGIGPVDLTKGKATPSGLQNLSPQDEPGIPFAPSAGYQSLILRAFGDLGLTQERAKEAIRAVERVLLKALNERPR